jgi:bifunctional UDP-N-acetylglucosamine pyrophosphorylase/glucosamine-1-phosphate N-acetyltransferase
MGTGHAVMQAQSPAGDCDAVLVLYGDMPLLRSDTLKDLWECYLASDSPIAMLVVVDEESRGFGRIIRGADGKVQAIVEQADCTPEQLEIKELNPAVYFFDSGWLWEHLERLPLHAEKGDGGEYFLTDLVQMAVEEGHKIVDLASRDPAEKMGVNTPEHLAEAEALLRQRGRQSSGTAIGAEK